MINIKSLRRTFRNLPVALKKKFVKLPLQEYVVVHHQYYTGRRINLENPTTFNDKINWLKAYYHPPILHQLVDKYEVRGFVAKHAGERYLNTLYKVYNSPQEINFDQLPESFVIKVTHGSGYNLLVPEKKKLDRKYALKRLKKWYNEDYYKTTGGEWAYKGVKPRIIAEQYLDDGKRAVINDYKVFCFNGTPRFVQVDVNRGTENHRLYYDFEWKKQPFYRNATGFSEIEVEKPFSLEEMKTVAANISEGFPFVRVDFYEVDKRLIFGEMTFYPADGLNLFLPLAYEKSIGKMIKLPEIKNGRAEITEWNRSDQSA